VTNDPIFYLIISGCCRRLHADGQPGVPVLKMLGGKRTTFQ